MAIKNCEDCKFISEDWAAGTGEKFCSHPDAAFMLGEKLNPVNDAINCDGYEEEDAATPPTDEKGEEIAGWYGGIPYKRDWNGEVYE